MPLGVEIGRYVQHSKDSAKPDIQLAPLMGYSAPVAPLLEKPRAATEAK